MSRASGAAIGGLTATLSEGSGIATSAKQDTGNSSLASIKTNTDKIPVLGQAAMAASTPVVIASNQTSIPVAATLAAETTKVIGTVNIAASQTIQLASGTNGIGKLTANDGVDIGNVDVASIAAGDNNIGNVDIASALPAGTNAVGKLLPPDIDVTTHTNYARKYYTSTGAATDGIIWSPAAGKRWHVVTMYIQISAAATITLEDDKAAGDDPVFKGEYAANSGVVLSFTEKYPMASGEDAADLTITTTAGNVYVTCVGYEI